MGGSEIARHQVSRTGRNFIGNRCPDLFAAYNALKAHLAHQARHRSARATAKPSPMKLTPDLAGTRDLPALSPYPLDFHPEGGIAFGAGRTTRGIDLTSLLRVVR
jgi:hypothetical protein